MASAERPPLSEMVSDYLRRDSCLFAPGGEENIGDPRMQTLTHCA
jgi:hypothetical protein